MAYDNLQALVDGRVSGRISEWPMLRAEAREALKEIAALKVDLSCKSIPRVRHSDAAWEKRTNNALADRDQWKQRAEDQHRALLEITEFSSGWKHGQEGVCLLRIDDLAKAALAAAKEPKMTDCPRCSRPEGHGHAPDCEVGMMLASAKSHHG